ncbi:alpha/beta-hydrolase [Annulohypoxylon maeteangense]|uniref:alpha/beta-hydrolase n=1 Tax=Annulohypoxylon maeteangense TaxID=1927788 RepID=UPI002008A419|nr:alpha/beta-hydrolase [Annulohypoxylon maeteangense]KAI0879880.1 alpha/beta-hydrolase [Annulohypoxylon maeteangense]
MSQKPAIVIAQGSWMNASAYDVILEKLHAAGYPAKHVKLPSIGSTATPLPGLPEDVAAIQSVLAKFRDAGRKVIILCHSSGGVSGSNATVGFDNVSGVIFLSAFMISKGKSLAQRPGGPPLPWMDMQGEQIFLHEDKLPDALYNDLDEESGLKWAKEVSSTSAALFGGVSNYEPWAEGVPCAYIFCDDDKALPMQVQREMATQFLGPDPITVNLKAGHSPFLSMPDELVAAIAKVESKMSQKSAK